MTEPVEIVAEGPVIRTSSASRLRRRVVALVGVVLLAMGAGFALSRDDPKGGAAGPEAAVAELLAALERQDVLAAAALLPPDEAPYVRLASFADQRFGPFGSSPLTLDGVAPSVVRELAPGIVEVAVADAGIDIDGPDAPVVRRLLDPDAPTGKRFGPDLRLVAVAQDDRWFVSPLYSLSQWLVTRLDLPPATFSAATLDGGVETAAELPSAVAAALTGDDLDGLLALVDVDGGRWIAAYRDAIGVLLDRAGVDGLGLLPAVLRVEVDTDLVGVESAPGGRRAVTVEEATVVLADDDTGSGSGSDADPDTGSDTAAGTGRYRYRDACLAAESDAADQACVPPEFFERSAIDDRLTILARQGPSGWRLDVLGSLVHLAEQAVASGDLDALLRAVGRTDLATVTPIETGVIVEVSTNAAGFATLSFDAQRPGLYSVGFGDRFDRAAVDGDGPRVDCAAAPCVVRVAVPGEHLLTVWQQSYAVTTGPVLVTPVSPDDVDDGDAITGTSTRVGPAAVLRLRGDLDPLVRPDGVDVVDARLRPVDCRGDRCVTDEGKPYFLIVRTIGPYDFTIRRHSEIEFVAGGKTAQGFIGNPGDSGVFELRLREGVEIDFGIRGERGLDIALRVRDPDGNEVGVVDDSGPDGFEGFRLRPKKSGVYRVELSGASGTTGLWFADLLVEGEDY